jgi:hypothetical protein
MAVLKMKVETSQIRHQLVGVGCGNVYSIHREKDVAVSDRAPAVYRPQLHTPYSLMFVFVVWCLVFGVWCLVFGVWCLVFGVWCLVFDV